MISYLTELNDENFDSFITKEFVLVDLYADWCGPCKMIAPIIAELSSEYKEKVSFGKCNVDNNRDIAMKLGIRNIPTILFYKNGEVVDKIIGGNSKQDFIDFIEKNISE